MKDLDFISVETFPKVKVQWVRFFSLQNGVCFMRLHHEGMEERKRSVLDHRKYR